MKTNRALIALMLLGALLFSGCSEARVGALRRESQSVELGNASSVRVKINMGAGDLELTGGAEKLLEADFNYNVARLKPEVEYTDGTLAVRQPEVRGFPVLQKIGDYRNDWDLRLYDNVPMDLSVDVGGGTSDLQLSGLSLTRLVINIGAGISIIDLTGDWARDLDVTIDAGATDVTVRLPKDVGVRVKVGSGPHAVDALGLIRDGDVYTNAAYGESDVTLNVNLEAGIGQIYLDVAEAAAMTEIQNQLI